MELLTKDLILRTVNDNDVNEVAKMWEWQKGPVSINEACEAICYMQDNHKKNKHGYIYHICFAVFEKGCDKIIGWCGLDGKNPKAKIKTALFYSIDTAYQNKGYATQSVLKLFEYLFESVGLERIDGGCYKENLASWRVMEKVGMILFEYDEKDGGPHFYIDKKIYFKNRFLSGGCENQVEKIGETVHRNIKGHPMLHSYLLYLEKEGMQGVPRFLGIDEQGREILSYISGKTMGRDFDYNHSCLGSDETVMKSARFMRKLHDISAGFVQTAIENGWKNPYFPDGKHEIICHGDAGIWNFVFVNELPVGLFDFDQAYPGSRFWDLASPLFCFLPSCYDYEPKHAERGKQRLKMFFDAYGMDYPDDIIEITARRILTFFKPDEDPNGEGHYQNIVRHLKTHGHEWL